MANGISGIIRKSGNVYGIVENTETVNGDISKAENVYVKELVFKNYFEFPSIGEADKLYVAKDENATYRFDDKTNTYICIGRDYTEIEVIQGI